MKKTNKLLVLLLVMLMAMSLFMTGCGSDSEEGQEGQEAGGTLVIALQEEIEGTDIQQIGWENVVHALIYEPLVKYNAETFLMLKQLKHLSKDSLQSVNMQETLKQLKASKQ